MLVNFNSKENMGWRFRKRTFYASEKKKKNSQVNQYKSRDRIAFNKVLAGNSRLRLV